MKTTKRNIEREHAKMVGRLKKKPKDIMADFFETDADLVHMALGLAGEAGEVVDAVKKYSIYGKCLDVKNLIEELGDIEFYAEGMRRIIGVTRREVLRRNIEKLTKRYGQQYSDRAAIERKDKA